MVYCHSAYLTYMQNTCCRNPASIPGLGRFPGEGKGYPFQDSGLEHSMDGMELVSGVAKSWTRLCSIHFHFSSCQMVGWKKHKLESRFRKIHHNIRYTDDTTLRAESKEKLKSLLMKLKEESEKLASNSTFRKPRSWHPVPSLHGK